MLISIGIVFLGSVIFHFLYPLFGKFFLLGVISPVNESVFEHKKVLFCPLVLFYVIFYFIGRDKFLLNGDKWFTCLLISVVFSLIHMCGTFYLVSAGLGVHSLFVDIIIALISIALGQIVAMHYYEHGWAIPRIWSLGLVVVIFILLIVFTYKPLKLPMFQDPETGNYGLITSSNVLLSFLF